MSGDNGSAAATTPATTPATEPAAAPAAARPKIAVWKFASCDGCQLSILDLEDELLDIAGAVDIAYFPEASRAMMAGPYDISFVEGSVTTPHDAERIREVRASSGLLVTIGACATSGGIQSLRNFTDVGRYTAQVYAHPEYISTLATSTPIDANVKVDLQLQGCPIDRFQLLRAIAALLAGRKPDIPGHSVCLECKRRGNTCVVVADGMPCLGPVVRAGCGALCPFFDRGCYGCWGPADTVNIPPLVRMWRQLGVGDADIARSLRTFNGYRTEFREASEALLAGLTADEGARFRGERGIDVKAGETIR